MSAQKTSKIPCRLLNLAGQKNSIHVMTLNQSMNKYNSKATQNQLNGLTDYPDCIVAYENEHTNSAFNDKETSKQGSSKFRLQIYSEASRIFTTLQVLRHRTNRRKFSLMN